MTIRDRIAVESNVARDNALGGARKGQLMTSARYLAPLIALAACGGDDGSTVAFEKVAQQQPGALLAVWGSTASDVWVVGSRPSSETTGAPAVLHYDGSTWQTMDTGQTSLDLWWVFGFEGGPVYMSGAGGTILRYQNGTFEKMTTPGTGVVFGMWGPAPDDIWATGGRFGGGGGGFIWHYDGTAWTNVDGAPTDMSLFKVNGQSSNAVTFTGEMGATLRWDGSSLVRTDIPTDATLFSIGCNDAGCVAVGGEVLRGGIYEDNGGGWTPAVPTVKDAMRGVAVTPTLAYAVGNSGLVMRRDADGWQEEENTASGLGLHAVWIDPDDGVWAVGGKFDDLPLRQGVLIHKGDPVTPL